jgi:hypothetical protein
MATGKTAILSLRIEPGLKEALRAAAEQEHRSIANMVEVMIREYCGRNSVALAEQPAPVYSKQSPQPTRQNRQEPRKTHEHQRSHRPHLQGARRPV